MKVRIGYDVGYDSIILIARTMFISRQGQLKEAEWYVCGMPAFSDFQEVEDWYAFSVKLARQEIRKWISRRGRPVTYSRARRITGAGLIPNR